MLKFSRSALAAGAVALELLSPAKGQTQTSLTEPSIPAFEDCTIGILKRRHKTVKSVTSHDLKAAVHACEGLLDGTGQKALVLDVKGRPRIFFVPDRTLEANKSPALKVTEALKARAG